MIAYAIKFATEGFRGADELIFDPVSSDLEQLEGLAEALGDRLQA